MLVSNYKEPSLKQCAGLTISLVNDEYYDTLKCVIASTLSGVRKRRAMLLDRKSHLDVLLQGYVCLDL